MGNKQITRYSVGLDRRTQKYYECIKRTLKKLNKQLTISVVSAVIVVVLVLMPISFYVFIFGMTDVQSVIQGFKDSQGEYYPFVYKYQDVFPKFLGFVANHYTLPDKCFQIIGAPPINGIVSLDGQHYVSPGTSPVMVGTCDSHNIVVGSVSDLDNWLNGYIHDSKDKLVGIISFIGIILPYFVPKIKKEIGASLARK